MEGNRARQQADVQGLTDVDTHVYEAVATLEYTGRAATRDQIAQAAGLDDAAADASLSALVGQGLVVSVPDADGPAFEVAERSWSVAPDRKQGM